jgi:hypothetical protein
VKVGISVENVHSILHRTVNMCYTCQNLVPKVLTPEHGEAQIRVTPGDQSLWLIKISFFFNNVIAIL